MKKRYYVYAHYNQEGKLFYIGKGTRNRDEDPTMRNKEWLYEAKEGYTSTIIADNLNNKQALLIEQAVIKALNNEGLVNKKIPSSIVVPYWKKPNSPQYNVSVNTPIKDAILCIEKQIEKHSLTQDEIDFLKIPRNSLNNKDKYKRSKIMAKKYKLKELHIRLNKAKKAF